MQKERLREKIIEEIRRLDYFSLQKLSAFISGLKSVKAQGKEGEGADYEDG
ncbi:hypothetical protein [Intestinimonas butyriciproducens]|uniref:hypothetical protein n=1 Tax=Intestinimonas butyriciproducens TaxID=1297617 RepID=UPI0012DFEE63|nr:hypothetical protein [Intestinimonas butyriciproducens]